MSICQDPNSGELVDCGTLPPIMIGGKPYADPSVGQLSELDWYRVLAAEGYAGQPVAPTAPGFTPSTGTVGVYKDLQAYLDMFVAAWANNTSGGQAPPNAAALLTQYANEQCALIPGDPQCQNIPAMVAAAMQSYQTAITPGVRVNLQPGLLQPTVPAGSVAPTTQPSAGGPGSTLVQGAPNYAGGFTPLAPAPVGATPSGSNPFINQSQGLQQQGRSNGGAAASTLADISGLGIVGAGVPGGSQGLLVLAAAIIVIVWLVKK